MKNLGFIRLGLAFSGCFLGAGYVSGQELWQFFGQYGIAGFAGLLLAVLLLCIIGSGALLLSRKVGYTDTGHLIFGNHSPALRWIVDLLEISFLFSVCIIMSAGVGALCSDIFQLHPAIGCAVFTLLVVAVSFAGLSGMVAVFSATVPILVVVTLIFGIYCLINGGIHFPVGTSAINNPLLRFWPVAAILFTCYNVFGSIAILSPLSEHLRSTRSIVLGIIFGALILMLVAASVLISVAAGGTADAELPMLNLAFMINRPLGWIYGILLLFAMFGTSLSCLVAFVRSTGEKFPSLTKHRVAFHLISAVVIYFCSLFGFGDLISVIYPIFGYLSSIFIVILLIRCFRSFKRKLPISK